jgi:hypothetical protein
MKMNLRKLRNLNFLMHLLIVSKMKNKNKKNINYESINNIIFNRYIRFYLK